LEMGIIPLHFIFKIWILCYLHIFMRYDWHSLQILCIFGHVLFFTTFISSIFTLDNLHSQFWTSFPMMIC
jgi:hypothetical protein